MSAGLEAAFAGLARLGVRLLGPQYDAAMLEADPHAVAVLYVQTDAPDRVWLRPSDDPALVAAAATFAGDYFARFAEVGPHEPWQPLADGSGWAVTLHAERLELG